MSIFGDRLKQLRAEKNLLQRDVSKHLGITTLAYQRYEYGDREPDFAKLASICQYFNVSSDYLLGLSDDPARR